MKEHDDDLGPLAEPGKIGKWLRDLDGEEFADVKAAVSREDRRRAANKKPSEMTDAEHSAWADQEFRKSEARTRAAKEEASRG